MLRKVSAGVRYALFRSGPMAGNGVTAGVFTRSDPRLERPDIQINLFEWSTKERSRDRVTPHRVSRLHDDAGASAPGRPRHGAAGQPRPVRPARGAVRLSAHRLRHPGGARRHPPGAPDRRTTGAASVYRGGDRPRLGHYQRRGPAGLCAPHRRVEPASDQFLRHGNRREHAWSIRACGCTGSPA